MGGQRNRTSRHAALMHYSQAAGGSIPVGHCHHSGHRQCGADPTAAYPQHRCADPLHQRWPRCGAALNVINISANQDAPLLTATFIAP